MPYIGSCYGFDAVLKYAGSLISKDNYSEKVDATMIKLGMEAASDPLLHEIPQIFRAFVGHKEACQSLPERATLLASSDNCPVQMVRFKKNIYANQFHCELDADGLEERIYLYSEYGYFDPSEAMSLVQKIQRVPMNYANQIFSNFMHTYRK